ncbi:3'-5' RNA helicase YTHDC2 [Episyrphus balteatus]|uniref:3'-5' RNA helicase YTHDC2 n=1 Tax=Episyrphus balteatus TaxID=286459 RepID=UPI00248567CA|nr:3'-5' RNA helicase YTHDC2 [Episyrphus balteatus]
MANNSNKQQSKSSKENNNLPRNVQRELKAKITHFLDYGETETLTLTGLPNDHRKFLHKYAASIGLKSKSSGGKDKRELHISLRAKRITLGHKKLLGLSDETRTYFDKSVLQELKEKMLEESIENCEQSRSRFRKGCLLLQLGPRLVPPRPQRVNPQIQRDRMDLPIAMYQTAINDVLRNNSVVIINGQTGSGKTTQVPQYILEECTRLNKPCRIICTQPRRIATVTVANRVAEERCEPIGETVGYQIRLESRMRRTTNLIYTTSGCVLRSIMGDARDFFQKITHLIIDEIHERDKDTDFILITVKEQLKYNKNLKVLLMSATMDINLLSSFFNDCPIVNVPGQGYNVKVYHLEDILFHTGYRSSLMEKYLRLATTDTPAKLVQADMHTQSNFDLIINEILEASGRLESTIEFFDQLQYYIENEGVAIDLCHSKSGKTALITAAQCNHPRYVKRFLQLNADINIRDFSGKSALTYAAAFEDGICLKLLAMSHQNNDIQMMEKQTLLTAYAQQFHDDNEVDHYLILSLIEGLYRSKHPGAILVFLPGYNDIVMQRDLIESTLPPGTYTMFILHGQMESSDQRMALQPQRNRKIILSTNIGQTSITIPDLAYIIDSGKVKMKTHDVVTSSSELRSVWISQADARQRSGRAGRTQNGVCYRLYSQERFFQMSPHCIPELMRIPLTEICLYAKSFDPQSDVQSFLSRALNPPSGLIVQNAIKKLKIIGVFTEDELITELGRHLVDIPVDVQLGKALMYGIFFKCVEPLTTIVAFHSVKDPFILPTDRALHGTASVQRKSLSGDYFSDQMGILVLYDSYMAIRNNRRRKQEFCNKHFLSMPCMDIFCSTRKQIYDVIVSKYSIAMGHPNNYDWNLIRMCLLAGLYPNIALIDRKRMTIKSGTDKHLLLQRSSSLNPPGKKSLKEFANKLPYDWLVFYEKSKLFNNYSINMNTLVPPVMIALQCGREHLVETEGDDEQLTNEENEQIARTSTLSLDSWIKFAMSENDADILVTLRSLVEIEFIKFLYLGHSETSEKAVEFVRFMLNAEVDECTLTFKQ